MCLWDFRYRLRGYLGIISWFYIVNSDNSTREYFSTVSWFCPIWRDFPLYIMLHALPIVSWLSKCMHTNDNGFSQKRIFIKKFRSLSTYSPTLSWDPSSKIIIELAINVSFEIFQRYYSFSKSKYMSTHEFYFICPVIFASLYPFNTVGYSYNGRHSLKYFLNAKTLFISI